MRIVTELTPDAEPGDVQMITTFPDLAIQMVERGK